MAEKTQKELLQEVHQGVYGVPDTDEKGLVGKMDDIVTEMRRMNGRVSRNSRLVYVILGVLITLGTIGGLEVTDIIQLIGG